jgi:hypothetical protein
MTLGEKILQKVILIILEKKLEDSVRLELTNILLAYQYSPDELDLKTIFKIENLVGEELLIIPTKQQQRKIKLERLANISNNSNNL